MGLVFYNLVTKKQNKTKTKAKKKTTNEILFTSGTTIATALIC